MAELPTDKWELLAFRNNLIAQRDKATATGDTASAQKIQKKIDHVQKTISRIAMEGAAGIAAALDDLRKELEALTEEVENWPFGSADAPEDHEKPNRDDQLAENDFLDPGPDQPPPAPAPVAIGTTPSVSAGWAAAYTKLWNTMEVSDTWSKSSRYICKKIVSNQHRYAKAVDGTTVPWWFIAIVHAMECSLRFDQHLHNGDTLTARTVRIPKDRPAAGSPPFSWEESARDAMEYDRLLGIKDWSLESALYHWHRYNGINNEYKRRGIPTPYLWSGCRHYKKGKYVKDGVFDPEAVSKQVGAAVLLKTLIELKAVKLDGNNNNIVSNAGSASGDVNTIELPLTSTNFKHAVEEFEFPGNLAVGAGAPGSSNAIKKSVRRVQEWLNLNGFSTGIDGDFGPSTEIQLKRFQTALGRPVTGELDEETWVTLTGPMRRALAPIEFAPSTSFEEAVVRIAKQHVAETPIEVGGANCGPWVRLYMRGKQGSDQLWCAGFACLIVAQAARDLKQKLPFTRRVGVDDLVEDAKNANRFIRGSRLDTAQKRLSALRPGMLFVIRKTSTDWTHVGIVRKVNEDTFETYEGNTNKAGGRDGIIACEKNRSYKSRDFLKLLKDS
ncbi:peptidoglycan-binding protein [uncultured Roseibium sp.]|uniref:peptidoglycan-binding protein n=1 Tax=uncultured Roseibium sp. TaxID=1936171 RepID=UPI0026103AD5|nr:peptidoglycan-binding protein [uncultured Roseibium sp.]